MSGLLDDSTPRFTIRDTGTIVGLVVMGAFGWSSVQASIAAQDRRITAIEAQQRANSSTLIKICEAVQCNKRGIEQ